MAPSSLTPKANDIKFVAVRGWLTHSILASQGYVLTKNIGDIGILASSLLNAPISQPRSIGIIPHHKNVENYQHLLSKVPQAQIIDLKTKDCGSIVDKIAGCSLIISESLHGLIVADSLEVPNVWLRGSPLHKGDEFKFLDYFSSIGRSPFKSVNIKEISDWRLIESAIYANWDDIRHLKSHVTHWLTEHFKSEN
jgi:hypothetical protein